MAVSIQYATLVSMIVQALFFGLYLVLFVYAQYILLAEPGRTFNRFLWCSSILMFLIATAQLVLDAQRFVVAFSILQNNALEQLVFLGSLNSGTFVAKNLMYQLQTYVGDACIIYRTYVLFGRKWWIVVVPSLLLVGCIVTGTGLIYHFAASSFGAVPSDFQNFGLTYLLMTLIGNIICTSLIVARIWRMSFGPLRTDRARFTPIIVIVESGAVYSAVLIVLSVLGGLQSPAYLILLDLLCPIIGITFVMIILRLHQEKPKSSVIVASNPRQPTFGTQAQSPIDYPMEEGNFKGVRRYSQKTLPPMMVMVDRETDIENYV